MPKLNAVPQSYRREFIEAQTVLTKNRTRLAALLAFGIYFSMSVVTAVLFSQEFRPQEIPLMIAMTASAFSVVFMTGRVKTLGSAKALAYLLAILIVAVITKINIIYYDFAELSSSVYVFVLFLAAFTIPWTPSESMILTAINIGGYSFFYFYLQYISVSGPIKPGFDFSDYGEGLLFILSAAVMVFVVRKNDTEKEIKSFVLLKEVEAKNKQMHRELELATKIHKMLVPRSISTNLVDIAALYLPAQYLGGDYARFHFVDKDRMIFVICDVTGHGVSAALLVNRIHIEFERLAKEGNEPGSLLKELNNFITRDFEGTNMYMSAFCGLLNFKSGRFLYSNHGHPTQYLYRVRESKILGFHSQSCPLGMPIEEESICQHDIEFEKGDAILLFTDGVLETVNREGEEFGMERLEKFIGNNYALSVNEFNQRLLDDLNDFKGCDFKDDISMLSIRIK